MTVSEMLKEASQRLKDCGVDNGSNEARWLLESVGGFTREYILLNPKAGVSQSDADKFGELIKRRASGEPLQYILGEWDFCGESFAVGEGVLIPRPETELLVSFACNLLRGKTGVTAVDLCAGSGCIGLTAAKRCPGAHFYLVEKFDEAFKFLEINARRFNLPNVTLVKDDLFGGVQVLAGAVPGLLLSNPPYIPSGETAQLQSEVLREPIQALDGGADGLDFYRAIAERWLSQMPCGSAAAFECGENQAQEVQRIISPYCAETGVITDFNNIRRAVTARVKG